MIEVLKAIITTLMICFGVLAIMFLITWIIDKVCKKVGWNCDRIFDGFLRLFMYLGGIGFGIMGMAILAMIGRGV